MAPVLTWSLDSTASTTLSVAKDVIRAATTDNVQPLALIACEKFGATLAMCQETNKKIGDLIIKVSGPKIVRFMSAQVGYSANDCATQLSRSLAGEQFLGLAAALVSSVDMFEGADALSMMLMASASDKTLLPTVRQLKDLLGAMEHRLNRSGFTDICVGYQIYLRGARSALYNLRDDPPREPFERLDKGSEYMCYPGSNGISKLVEAFGELNRLGDATTITIQATSCAPWVMAFTKWCLGIPPSTYLPDGKALLDQPASRVTLFTSNDAKASAFEITVQRSIDSPVDLFKSEVSSPTHFGMVTVECVGRMICQEMGGERSDAYRALSQALPYALKQICEHLIVVGWPLALNAGLPREFKMVGRQFSGVWKIMKKHNLFPQDFRICNILTRVLNSESQQDLQHLNEGHRIQDLPLVQAYLRHLVKDCTCKSCYSTLQKSTENPEEWKKCEKMAGETFLDQIALYAANILALSLFENPETLLLHIDNVNYDHTDRFVAQVRNTINSGEGACGASDILARALVLVGHKTEDVEKRQWVISCSKGQAVYPRVFETENIAQPGYLMLHWAPGSLFFSGETYTRGIHPQVGPWNVSIDVTDTVSTHMPRPVTRPLNLVPNMKMEWKVVRRDGYLEVYPACGHHVGRAFNVLSTLTNALILEGCPHDSASPLDSPDLFASYRGPFLSLKNSHRYAQAGTSPEAERRVNIVAVDGDVGLRMFAIGTYNPRTQHTPQVVIRSNACLQCCLDLCRRARAPYLIC